MPIAEPLGFFGFWETVRETVPWPHSDEDALDDLGAAWSVAGGEFSAAGAPGEAGLATAWPDPAGEAYQQSIGQLRADARAAGAGMRTLGVLTTTYAYDVRYAKDQIVQTIVSNFGFYLTARAAGREREFTDRVALVLGEFLDALAGQVAARGARTDPYREEELPVVQPVDAPRPPLDPVRQLGADRERLVGRLSGGTVVTEPGGEGPAIGGPGGTDVDVIGPNGEFIAVGGPAKGRPGEFQKTLDKLRILQQAAEAEGVAAQAWFADGTDAATLAAAQRIVGPGNVVVFEEE